MSGGRKRVTPRARRVGGENDDAARPAQHPAPIATPTQRVVREVPRDSVPQRRRRPDPLHPDTVAANIAAGWARKAKRDAEARGERAESEGESR